jgi:hypothetical protein
MLQQKQGMADAACFHESDNRLLQLQRSGVVYAAKINDVDNTERHKLILCHV